VTSVFLVECLAAAAGQSQCDIDTATPAAITANGVLPSTKFKVLTGKIGNGTCGTKPSTLKKCVINAGNSSGGDTATAPNCVQGTEGDGEEVVVGRQTSPVHHCIREPADDYLAGPPRCGDQL
jgi:hypothetical protein